MDRFWFKFVKISMVACTLLIGISYLYWLFAGLTTVYGGWTTICTTLGVPAVQIFITWCIAKVEKLEAEFESEQAVRRVPTWLR